MLGAEAGCRGHFPPLTRLLPDGLLVRRANGFLLRQPAWAGVRGSTVGGRAVGGAYGRLQAGGKGGEGWVGGVWNQESGRNLTEMHRGGRERRW